MAVDASYLHPFVVDTEPVTSTRIDDVDLYLPSPSDHVPLVVLVHGGPMRNPPEVPASHWPVYRGYAQLLCANEVAGAVFDHGLLSGDRTAALAELRAAVATARGADAVDGSRVVLWFFSGAGLLSARYLSGPPEWLQGAAFSYPVLHADEAEWNPCAALRPGLTRPLLLTRVGQENPGLVGGQSQFVYEASRLGIPLDTIEVVHGRHAFDCAEPTPESQAAVHRAIQWILARLA